MATAVFVAWAAIACGGPSTEPDAAPPDPAAMVDSAMGGTRAVQDFLIHLDMLAQTDDGPVSYYDEVLGTAAEGAVDPVGLTSGLELRRVTSLDGRMVDGRRWHIR